MLTDIEIAQKANKKDIREIAKKLNLTEDELELYGKYKAKIDYNLLKNKKEDKSSSKPSFIASSQITLAFIN